MIKVWVVDDDNSIRWVLEKALSQGGFDVESFATGELILQRLEHDRPEAIFSDIKMPNMDGMELLQTIQQKYPDLPVVIMTAHSDLDSAVNAFQHGAFEYLPKPFDIDDAVALAKKAVEHSKNIAKKNKPEDNQPASEIIGEAPAMQEVFRAIGRLSRSSVSVLINGQSGTGKELVAHALHKHSPRSAETFVALNMAAIPKDLIESELFGHEKGAFTGATATKKGRFEQANGGTLFLDEIGDMPLDVQTRLLRVLAEGQFYRVGGHDPVTVDVRIVAATHQNLEELVNENRFREDLFHRLNVIRIHIPALKDRQQDIAKLCRHFLHTAAQELAVEVKSISKPALSFLESYRWPGNVRQLENTCRWLTVMASGKEILYDDLPPEMLEENAQSGSSVVINSEVNSSDWTLLFEQWVQEQLSAGSVDINAQAQADFERTLINKTLEFCNGHRQLAAKKIGWGRNTITRKMKDLNLN
ncbi:nitrogen regulation protein NR(I) [Psychrosphaera haliotis]|uniref:DNA-binding transcriptional regulator NtrC n=1 Tax=Psychrosphaera haliotis TaxID=555083 RepID=A0A6N8FBX4_9GAMM|nr:nitrogen regulation protein NR(I) [Psychrosphaera haliotis]MUH72657.1 nitrogen regulation protein NR(I) [Psychrosphaera haliotis]